LAEGGFVVGRDVQIEYRWAEGRTERLAALADALVGRRVAVLLVSGGVAAARAALAATKDIPIVFTAGDDVVKAGLVQSVNRPGGTMTGVMFRQDDVGPKRLQFLHELLPSAHSVGVLTQPGANDERLPDAARKLGLELHFVAVARESDLEAAFGEFAHQHVDAALIGDFSPVLVSWTKTIVALAARDRLPFMFLSRADVEAGGLVSYGPDVPDAIRQAGLYVARILKGEKPADLPIILEDRFELVLNLKTAKALGIEVPPLLLTGADEVIE
jgi:putative tryptophan/tyrosine transport system substrate-binding protein